MTLAYLVQHGEKEASNCMDAAFMSLELLSLELHDRGIHVV